MQYVHDAAHAEFRPHHGILLGGSKHGQASVR